MKTFENLVFETHPMGNGFMSKMFFPNGYGVSVVRFKSPFGGGGSYTNGDQWEVAVLKGNHEDWDLCYDTDITNNVIGYLTDNEVTEIMGRIQNLPMVEYKLN